MKKTTDQSNHWMNFRGKLLTSACGAALLITAFQPVEASEGDRPVVWIELGGAFTRLENNQEAYLPPFMQGGSHLPFIMVSPADLQKSMPTGWDGNAAVALELPKTDWSLSVGIVYGRSSRSEALRQQTAQRSPTQNVGYQASQTTDARNAENHMILDFQAGKDVGLGVFGSSGHSKVSFGVRYVQFKSEDNANILYHPTNAHNTYHQFSGTLALERQFTGIGPSLSWNASAGLSGDAADAGVFLDWSVNGAVLFGHQRVRGHHQTTNIAVTYVSGQHRNPVYQNSVPLNRSKQVIVPDFGGFAGISWRYPNAKVSIGYRADLFFGAIDGGIDTRKSENRGFHGPFASISVGIGD